MALIEDVSKTSIVYLGTYGNFFVHEVSKYRLDDLLDVWIYKNINILQKGKDIVQIGPIISTHDLRWIIACAYND